MTMPDASGLPFLTKETKYLRLWSLRYLAESERRVLLTKFTECAPLTTLWIPIEAIPVIEDNQCSRLQEVAAKL